MYMNIITSTELRTKMPEVIATILSGGSIDLVHRSKIVGEIKPKKYQAKPLTAADIRHIKILAQKLRLPKLSYKEREKRYRKHVMEKYGKGLS